MTLRIYGVAASRAARPLWVAQELGLDYEHIALPFQGGATRTPEFLAINPNGRIPVIDDDGVLVWESMACVLYLAKRFNTARTRDGQSLAAQGHAEEAGVLRWTFWVVTECEKDALTFLMHSSRMPEERRKPQLAQEAAQRLRAPLRVLNHHLQSRPWLAADRFTVADIAVASVLAWVQQAPVLAETFPHVDGWLRRCLARPAFLAVNSMTNIPSAATNIP